GGREEAELVGDPVERAVDVRDLPRRRVVVDPEPAADHGAPGPPGVEGEAQARAERLLVVLARAAVEERGLSLQGMRVARVHEPALVLVAEAEVQREPAA